MTEKRKRPRKAGADLCLAAGDRRNHTKRTTQGLVRDERPGRYPSAPGAKGHDGTSQAAAAAIANRVSYLRRVALVTLLRLGEAVEYEVSKASGHTRDSIQPRLSELRELGLVAPTGARKRNPSGKMAAVLRLTGRGRALAERFQAQSRRGGSA